MNTKTLFSSAGLLTIAGLLLLSVAVISLLPPARIDLTEDRLYTLSEGTHNILGNLSKPIEMIFFYSDEATADVPQIRTYAQRVQELLREMVLASNGNLSYRTVDPQPFSEDEDLATQFGIQAVPISQGGEEVYFGLVVAEDLSDQEPGLMRASETLPLIRPDQEAFLEYEFMKLITRVEHPERPVLGIITELDMDGGFNPAFGGATAPWMMTDVVRQMYETRRIPTSATEIDPDIDMLFIVHPEGLSEQLVYAIDQHILRNGKAMVFLDPMADSMVQRSDLGVTIPAGIASNLPALLAAWGVDYDPGKVLTDQQLALRVLMEQNGRPVAHLGMLGVQRPGLTPGDIITSRLESVNLSSAGALAPADGAATRFEPLIQSSMEAMLMDASLMENVTDPTVLYDEFESANQRFTVAARVTGLIDSAFPDGPPVLASTEDETTDPDSADPTTDAADPAEPVADAAADSAETAPAVEHLSRSQGEVTLILVADTDFLSDRLWVQVSQFLGQRIPQPFANNADFVVNALDNLSGGADLVSIRSRGRYSRPFTTVLDLQRAADDRLREEEAVLLETLSATEERLNELSQGEDGQPILQITPELQAEIDRVNEEILATRRRLRDVQHQLNEDIEALGSRLKAVNTLLMPGLLTLLMLGLAWSRAQRRRTAAA